MSVFKTTFSRALRVYPSDDANIPSPNVITSGTNTSIVANQLNNSNATFITDNIQAGDIVYNVITGASATIASPLNQVEIQLNADIFTSSEQEYIIYQASSQTGLGNPGCYLYIGSSVQGTIVVTTIGGDVIYFFNVLQGTVLPVQVIKLHATGTENINRIIALW